MADPRDVAAPVAAPQATTADGLRESEQHFRATFELAPIGMAHVSLDGAWLAVNQAWCRILGYERDELLSRRFQELTHPEDLAADVEQARRLVAGEIPSYVLDKRYVRKDGSIVATRLMRTLVRDERGAPFYFLTVLEDLTARTSATTALGAADTPAAPVLATSPASVQAPVESRWASPALRSPLRLLGRYGVAVAAPLVALALTLPLAARLETFPVALFVIAVMVSAYAGGAGPGLVAAMLSALGMSYYLSRPLLSFRVDSATDLTRLGLFLVTAAVVSALSDRLRRARDRARALAAELGARNAELQTQASELDVQRQQLEDQAVELETANDQLQHQAAELEARGEELRQSADELRRRSAAGEDALEALAAREAALRAQTAFLDGVLAATPDVVAVKDRDQRYLLVNAACARVIGRPPEEIVGRADEELYPAPIAAALRASDQRVIATGAAITITELVPDASGGAMRAWTSVKAPLRDATGGVVGVVLVARDETERRAAEVALAERERLLQTIARNATLALFVMDERQQCVYMNPAAERLTGYTLNETWGRALHDVVHHTRPDGSPYPLADCPIDRALPENNAERGTEVFVHKDGSFYPVAFTASPIRDEVTGVPLGTVIEVRDIRAELAAAAERERLLAAERVARAEAEQQRAEAVAASRAKGEFLAVMSHELRTPLNAISGHVQLLEMELHGPLTDAQRDALARVQRAQRHLLSLINDVLNFAKLEAGKVEYDVREVDLSSLIADVAPMIEPQVGAKGLTYEVRPPAGGCLAWADSDKLRQILLNLLANAVKFTTKGGRITLGVATRRETPDVVYLRVEDTGIGISRAQQATIFDPFVQVFRAGSREGEGGAGGVGLGLAISRDLARGMGGDLRVRSTEGAGSTFTVTLRRVVTAIGEPTDPRRRDRRRPGKRRSGE